MAGYSHLNGAGFRYTLEVSASKGSSRNSGHAAGIRGNIILLVVNDDPAWCQIKILRMEGLAQEFLVAVKIKYRDWLSASLQSLKLYPILDILDIRRIVLIKVAERHFSASWASQVSDVRRVDP